MSTLEKAQHFLVALQQSIGSLFKILIRSKYFIHLPSPKSKRIIIMGNGPSLKKVLAEQSALLKKETKMGVNHFADTEHYEILQPELYMIAAPEFWMENINEAALKRRDVLFANFIKKTTWDLQLFIPASGLRSRYLKNQLKDFPKNITVVPYNITPVEGLRSVDYFCFRRNWGMPRPHNVIVPCLMNTINVGYEEILLIGVEHSWLPEVSVTEDNVALVHQKHFYDEGSTHSEPMQKLQMRPRRLYEILEKFMLTFRAYHIIEEYAQNKKVQIFNCTAGSFIDAFKRKSLEALIDEIKLS